MRNEINEAGRRHNRMKKVTFSEERRGYDKEQVEKYISLLQNAIEELEKESQEKEQESQEYRTKFSEKQKEIDRAERDISILREQQASQEEEFRATCKLLQNTIDKLNKEAVEKEEILIKIKKENDSLHMKIVELEEQESDPVTPRSLESDFITVEERNELLDKLEVAEKERKKLQKDITDLQSEKEALLQKQEKQKDEISHFSEKPFPTGIEELFVQAKESADAYLKSMQKQVQEERRHLNEENEKLMREAREKAEKIVEEARAVKQEELDEKLNQINRMELERQAEIEEILQNAKDELESAQIEADAIRSQSKIILQQAEIRRDNIIDRAKEKAVLLNGPVKEECENLRKEMEKAAKQFVEIYKNLEPEVYTNSQSSNKE